MQEKKWDKGSHEYKVNKFYSHGVENYGDFHGGYLNFGYWENEGEDYLVAAHRLIHKLAEMLNLDEQSDLLDVACGMGGQCIYIAQNFNVGTITGFDLVFEHLKWAKWRLDKTKLDNVKFVQGTAVDMEFDNETFSHILCVEGIVHFKTREKFFEECHRVLKPNGRVVFSDYAIKKKPKNKFEDFLLKTTTDLWNIPRDNFSTPEEYKLNLESKGFKNVKVHCVGDNVIPGYCKEQAKKDCINELSRIRGFIAGRLGHIIDIVLDWTYKKGLCDYILVEADKA
jgi:SAM-dependent methyltransferase